MKAACIIVTIGNRPDELARCLESAHAQRDVECEIILVANGCEPPPVPAGTVVVETGENLGPVGARNRALERVTQEVVFFLDDDTWYPSDDVMARALERFEADPTVGIMSFRIDDPSGAPRQRRHVPRLIVGDPFRSSDVTSFIEGHCAVRRAVFDQVGPYPESFFGWHEGLDLAWRAIDAGWRVRYVGDIAVNHPAEPPTRHSFYNRLTARNRVFLVRRLLPWPVGVVHLGAWFVLGLARAGSLGGARDFIKGWVEGFRADPGPRRPVGWRAIWRMTKVGRPPIV